MRGTGRIVGQAPRPHTRPPGASRSTLLALLALLGSIGLAGCTLAPAPGSETTVSDDTRLPPPGYGTLRQDEVTIQMMSGPLQIQVTPLHESITRVTAPDTWERLSAMATAHRERVPAGSILFLVSFFSDQPGIRFVPEEVQLISRGIRMRPTAILPVTPTWGQGRLQQRETEMAVYAFPSGIDLEADLELAYQLEQTSSWTGIITRVQAERGRARGRAGIGG